MKSYLLLCGEDSDFFFFLNLSYVCIVQKILLKANPCTVFGLKCRQKVSIS